MPTEKFLVISGFLLLLLTFVFSCATVEKQAGGAQGAAGTVVLTNEEGEDAGYPPKEDVLVNFVPVMDGERRFDRSVRIFPSADGIFFGRLEKGKYTIEVFLQGFYVRSIDITVLQDRVTDLGIIKLQRIMTDPGMPVKAGPEQDVILKEGDVNIEPPSF